MDSRKITTESYDITASEYIEKIKTMHPKEFGNKFMKLLKAGGSILDVGCAGGRDATLFVNKGFQVTGIDLSSRMIEEATKKEKRATFQVMDVTQLSFSSNSFDGVWANVIFLHLDREQFKKGLEELFRVLKPGGIVYVSVKKGEGKGFESDERVRGVKKFWAYYQEADVKNFLQEAGFLLIEQNTSEMDHAMATHPFIRFIARKS